MSHIAVICESSLSELTQEELTDLILKEEVVGHELPLYVVLAKVGLSDSSSQAKAQIKQNGVTFGHDKIKAKENDTIIFLTRK